MVSKGVPKMFQKTLKIHSGTFQSPSVCIRDPLDCKMVPKWCPRTSKRTKNGHLGTLKDAKKLTKPNNQVYNKQIHICHVLIDFNPGNQCFDSCQSFQSANQQSTGCPRGWRQGRSLNIYIYIYITGNIEIAFSLDFHSDVVFLTV